MSNIKDIMVTVCIVTYNQEKWIKQTLDSVITQQTKYPFEVIIGEDHGTDGTRAVCQEYADKYDNPYTYMNLKRWGCPQKLYGRLTDLKSAYSTYDGYDEALAQYEQYDLIIGLRYPAEASMIVQTETQKTLEPIFLYGGIICLILGVILGKIRR